MDKALCILGILCSIAIMSGSRFEIIIDEPYSKIEGCNNLYEKIIINQFQDGTWWTKNFIDYILNKVFLSSLSREETEALINAEEFNSLQQRSIESLRGYTNEKDTGLGGEIAEILLYGLMKDYFSALVATPKIFYKQSKGDPVKGSDSCHITIDGENFNLWLGEAKFFKNVSSQEIKNIVSSVLDIPKVDRLRKENRIIRNLNDLEISLRKENKGHLYQNIKDSLSEIVSIDKIKNILNIPILILYQCDCTQNSSAADEEYKINIKNSAHIHIEAIFKKLTQDSNIFLFDKIKFHLILFPVHNKDEVNNAFYTATGLRES